jgi:PPM family protein phosphatase
MRLKVFQFTAVGDRKINQDAMAHIVKKDYGLFIVADGLGGHYAGEKASKYFCKGMVKLAKKYQKLIALSPSETHFANWINAAIEEMANFFGDDHWADEAHTTCAVLYVDRNVTMTGHCGDSRIYRMNPKQILWRTEDHSIPQQLLNEGMITEKEVARHPEQNRLTRTVNIRNKDCVEIKTHPPVDINETFVLCSDGFWGKIKQEEILQLASLNSGKDNLARLVRLSIYRAIGKSDNITVFTVKCLKQ